MYGESPDFTNFCIKKRHFIGFNFFMKGDVDIINCHSNIFLVQDYVCTPIKVVFIAFLIRGYEPSKSYLTN